MKKRASIIFLAMFLLLSSCSHEVNKPDDKDKKPHNNTPVVYSIVIENTSSKYVQYVFDGKIDNLLPRGNSYDERENNNNSKLYLLSYYPEKPITNEPNINLLEEWINQTTVKYTFVSELYPFSIKIVSDYYIRYLSWITVNDIGFFDTQMINEKLGIPKKYPLVVSDKTFENTLYFEKIDGLCEIDFRVNSSVYDRWVTNPQQLYQTINSSLTIYLEIDSKSILIKPFNEPPNYIITYVIDGNEISILSVVDKFERSKPSEIIY